MFAIVNIFYTYIHVKAKAKGKGEIECYYFEHAQCSLNIYECDHYARKNSNTKQKKVYIDKICQLWNLLNFNHFDAEYKRKSIYQTHTCEERI